MDVDSSFLQKGSEVLLATIRPCLKSAPKCGVTPAVAQNNSIARNNSSTVTAVQWNRQKLRKIKSDACSDKQELTRFSEEPQHVERSERRDQNVQNVAIVHGRGRSAKRSYKLRSATAV